MTRRRAGRFEAKHIVIAVVVLLLAYLVLVPLIFLLWKTFVADDGTAGLSGFAHAFPDNADTWAMVGNTLAFAFGSMVVSMVIGGGFAYLAERTDVPFRRLLSLAALVPLIIPAILYAPAWIFLGSANIGLMNNVTGFLFGIRPFDVYSVWGMIWVQSLHSAPIVFLLLSAAFRASDPSMEEAGRVAGLGGWRVLTRITLPMVKPALAGAALIVFIQSLEVFEIPTFLGLPAGHYVLTSRLYYLYQQYPTDYQAVGAIGVGLLVIACLGVWLAGRVGGSLRESGTISGKAFRPRRKKLGRARPWAGLLVLGYFVLAVALPLLILLYSSLLKTYEQPGIHALGDLSLNNYRTLFSDPGIVGSFENTMIVAVCAATAAMVLATVASWIVVRTGGAGRRFLDALTFSPLVIPGLVFGVALAVVYLRVSLPIYGTLVILFIAYTTRFLPYGMRYASAALSTVSRELEESAQVAGARWFTTMRRVLLPLAAPGVIGGWVYILIVSFRELQSSILLYTPGKEVVSVTIFQQYQDGNATLVSAIGVVLVLLLTVLVVVSQTIAARRGVRAE
ncbi:ABC transporter permease [Labedaea rhizosphaerae]|uniref:ABC transporter permease n=1 Tax=Labedaea rhizosphaerae TaxID=598644 RepID=UPI001AADFC02|nr:iron ABC transporter permease [Labedaea rhizosphaerae]